MSDIEEVTQIGMETLRGLRDGSVDPKVAVEVYNGIGKIVSAYKVRVAYHALRQERPEIPGLTTTPERAQITAQ